MVYVPMLSGSLQKCGITTGNGKQRCMDGKKYVNIEKEINIDFRRVVNLRVFEEYALSLTLDTDKIKEWQPGDIVIFGNDKHIGIVSDKRNSQGQPYIIHNGGQPKREEDYFKRGEVTEQGRVTGHYRFDASKISDDVLVKWQEAEY